MATGRLPDPNTAPVTAKGDLYTYSTVPAKLAVGSNGETLVADSSAATGLRYQEPKAGNPFVNAAFQVWQRGTSFSVSGSASYTADRWQAISAAYTAGLTVSRQTTGDTTNLPNIQYCARVQRDSGNTSTAARNLQQCFESVNSIPFAGKTVTLSFYARAGANFSAASSALGVQWVWGTGTDQNLYLAGYTGQTNISATTAVTLTTTWQRFSITGTIGSTATEIALNFNFSGVGTAGANDYFEVTGVQMEVGSVATPFKTQGVTLAGEFQAAQRYYREITSAMGIGQSTTAIQCSLSHLGMRGTPTAAVSAAVQITDVTTANFTQSSSNITINENNSEGGRYQLANFTGLTGNRPYIVVTSSGKIQLSAEL